jgi:hypothetical protein
MPGRPEEPKVELLNEKAGAQPGSPGITGKLQGLNAKCQLLAVHGLNAEC